MSDIVSVQRRISKLDVSPQFDSYSKVVIHVSDDTTYEYGTDTGRTLEFDNPFGSQQMARDVLARLQGYQYQPYTADGTILNPAAEIGDALNSALVYGGIYTRSKTFGRLMQADVSAPQDEEINHEYKYESPEQREFKRQLEDVRASLIIANDNINAKVSQTGGNQSTFGWTLTASGFSLFSGNTEVMKCDSSGLVVKGNIAGSTGTIGGFTISSSALYTNNMASMSSSQASGVHLSGSGIKLGQNFQVDSSGNLTCSNANISGTLTVGGRQITAAALQQGAAAAYSGAGGWNSTSSTVNTNASNWTEGANGGRQFIRSTQYGDTSTGYFVAGSIAGRNGGTLGSTSNASVVVKGRGVNWHDSVRVLTYVSLNEFYNQYTQQYSYSLSASYGYLTYLGN